jgi:brefeldin A-inhibited guanine nucleotide-exchange protein
MSVNNDAEMMEDVSLEDGNTVLPDLSEKQTIASRHAAVDQQVSGRPISDRDDAPVRGKDGANFSEVNLAEPEQVQQEISTSSVSDDQPPTSAALSSPPPVPDKETSGHTVNSSVNTLNHPEPQGHRPHPSISVTPGVNSIYRAGTPATASRTSFSSVPHLSLALIKPGLELIAQSKEAKRSPALLQASQRALDLCQREGSSAVPRDILEPLKLACELQVDRLVSPALDLIAKLVSHGFFSDESDASRDGPSLADIITHIITTAYTEASSPAVSVQVVKSLLAIVLSTTLSVHQSSLLKAVRTVYNVYLLSTDPSTQLVAQGSLTQMIHHIFGRVKKSDKSALMTPSTAHRRSGSVTPGVDGKHSRSEEGSDGERASRAEEFDRTNGVDHDQTRDDPEGKNLTL